MTISLLVIIIYNNLENKPDSGKTLLLVPHIIVIPHRVGQVLGLHSEKQMTIENNQFYYHHFIVLVFDIYCCSLHEFIKLV